MTGPQQPGPRGSEDRTVPVSPDTTVPVTRPDADPTVEMRRPRPPEQPWYLAHRRPEPDRIPPGRPPIPVHRPTPAASPPPRPAAQSATRSPAQKPAAAAAPPDSTPTRNTARNLLLGVTVVLFAVAGVLAVVLLGRPRGGGVTELDVTAAQQGVRAVLTDPINGYGRDDVSDVRCNDGRNPLVRNGTGFTCTVTVDGAARRVAVVFTDDAGTYEVDGPR